MLVPKIAIMAPIPTGTASCIAFPLSFNKYKASSKFKELEQTNALYSPKEWPAKNLKFFMSKFNSFSSILRIE